MSADKQIEVAVQKLAGTYLKDIVSILYYDRRRCVDSSTGSPAMCGG